MQKGRKNSLMGKALNEEDDVRKNNNKQINKISKVTAYLFIYIFLS